MQQCISPFIPRVEDLSRNGLVASNASSPGATSNQFKKELESTNGTLLPTTHIPSGSSSIVNLEDIEKTADEDDERRKIEEVSFCLLGFNLAMPFYLYLLSIG